MQDMEAQVVEANKRAAQAEDRVSEVFFSLEFCSQSVHDFCSSLSSDLKEIFSQVVLENLNSQFSVCDVNEQCGTLKNL